MGLMTEMNACFEELAHGEFRQCHAVLSFSGWSAADV
jgi:hypothetical protein